MALLVGLVLGAGGLGAVWAYSANGYLGDTAQADAAASCNALALVGTIDEDFDKATMLRMNGAHVLAQAAVEKDKYYQSLLKATEDAEYARATGDVAVFNTAVAKAKDLCADL
ncbi:hypothetical protein AB0M36_35670 [Actinoplanes sp. NPDC051346]|uniref:hypothetical protein n=1 Tax=Actinoplanes sp. NPDC051346 TaxID=3155048 RepID=UPI00341E1D03